MLRKADGEMETVSVQERQKRTSQKQSQSFLQGHRRGTVLTAPPQEMLGFTAVINCCSVCWALTECPALFPQFPCDGSIS